MYVLITGSTGRIGANIVKRLVERGDRVRCQVRPGSDRRAKLDQFGVEVVEVDLTDRPKLTQIVCGIDAIVHMGVKLRGPSNFDHLDINIAPTLTLLEAVRTENPTLERFVYGSSDALFPHEGYMPELITADRKFTRPADMYKVSKVASEAIVQCYHQQYGIPSVILSIPWTFCGSELLGLRAKDISPVIDDQIEVLKGDLSRGTENRDRVTRALVDLKRAKEQGAHWVIPKNPQGTPWMRHIGDVRDVADAAIAALDTARGVGGAYVIMSDALNFGIGVPYLAEESGMPFAEILWPYAQHYWYDTSATRDELRWRPRYDSRSMLVDAWRHLKGEDIGVVDVGPNHALGSGAVL